MRVLLAVAFLAFGSIAQAREPGPFYTATAEELAGPPGTLIRSEPMPAYLKDLPANATAVRVLYRSTGLKGEPIAVSGVILVPKGAPAIPRPIVAWAHPTSGIEPQCAPSLASVIYDRIPGLRAMLDLGFIVTATDYPGLGTQGTHPYMIGMSAGRAVLDSVRAARALEGAQASNRAVFWGHSQGGHAVLFAGLLAKSYAPEIHLNGVAAAAPATDLGQLLDDDFGTEGGDNLFAMALWSWSRLYNQTLTSTVGAPAVPVIEQLAKVCLETVVDIAPRAILGRELLDRMPKTDGFISKEPWRTLIQENTPGPLPPSIPVFIAQGTTDTTVRPAVTEAYVKELCAGGSAVDLVEETDTGHAFIAIRPRRRR